MKSQKQYKIDAATQLGLDPAILEANSPEKEYIYLTYKGGECKICSSNKEAMEFSKLIEKVEKEESKIQYENFWNSRHKIEQLASDMFHKDLREEYSYLNQQMYNACYQEAYDRGHACGYDEVVARMSGIVDFAEKIVKLCEGGE